MTRREHRVLVVGGLGFQGSHFVEALLQRGTPVTILSTPSQRNQARLRNLKVVTPGLLNWTYGSVADAEILEKVIPGHDAVIHMAAWASVDASLERPWPPFEINAQGTYALLEALRRFGDKGCKAIIASSCEVYGPTKTRRRGVLPDGAPRPPIDSLVREFSDALEAQAPGTTDLVMVTQDEDWPLLPRSPYAASKVAADRFAYAHAITYNLPITILRPCNVYGPGQEAGALGAVIPKFTRAALRGEVLQVTGTGQQFREFLHVDDLVAAYLAVLDAPPGEPGSTYNVGSGETRCIADLAQTITGLIPEAEGFQFVPGRTADVTGFLLDSTRFQAQFGWKPRVPFTDGLAHYVTWARACQRLEEKS